MSSYCAVGKSTLLRLDRRLQERDETCQFPAGRDEFDAYGLVNRLYG